MANKPTYIIIHHTATDRNTTTFKAVDNYHKKYGGIAYHYLITPKKAYKGRGEAVVGAHTLYHNSKSIGFCLTGNFQTEKPHPFQLKELERLVRIVEKRYKIPRSRIIGHREAKRNNTACPGNNLMPFIRELRKPPKPKGIGKALASELGSRLLGRKWTASASFYNRNMEQFIQAIINSTEYKKKRGKDYCAIEKQEIKVWRDKLQIEAIAHVWFRDTEVPRYQGLIEGLEESLRIQRRISNDLMVESAQLKGYITTLEADAQLGRGVRETWLAIKNAFERLARRVKNG